MANYANQTKILIDQRAVNQVIHHKDERTNGYIPPLECEYVYAAARQLNGNAFKLWLYLLNWYNQGYVFFSPSAIEAAIGMKKSSISDSKRELIQKGFIVEDGSKITYTPISTLLV